MASARGKLVTQMQSMKCLICGFNDPNKLCSFHPGRREKVYNAGARDDYRDVYFWSCCAESELSTVSSISSESDIPPPYSPGCVTAKNHVFEARIEFFSSANDNQVALTNDCAEWLRVRGFKVQTKSLADANVKELLNSDCVVLLPDVRDRAIADRLADDLMDRDISPWVLLCNTTPGGEYSRVQLISANQLKEAVLQAIRLHNAPRGPSPFKLFLSYRRVKSAVAQCVHRFCSCWWDQKVLSPGVDWATEIELAIKDCEKFFIILRGWLPKESYVWHELRIAIKYAKPIIVFSFRHEGNQIFEACNVSNDELEFGKLTPKSNSTYFYYCRDRASPFIYFCNLEAQLQWPPYSNDWYDFDTPSAVTLLAALRGLRRDDRRYRLLNSLLYPEG